MDAESGTGGAGEGTGNEPPVIPGRGVGSRKEKNKNDKEVKEEVKRKIAAGQYQVVKVDDGHPLQSPAWQKFGRVVEPSASGGKPKQLNFVQCLNPACGIVKIVRSGNRGALASHSCKVRLEAAANTPLPPSNSAKERFEESLITLIVGQLLPPHLVSSPEFSSFVKTCLEIGANASGPLDAKQLIPHPTTLTEHIKDTAMRARSVLVEEIKEDVEDGLASATIDAWTDSQRGRKYLAHTVDTVNEVFEYCDNLLFIPHCNAESVTAEVILDVVQTSKAEVNIDVESKIHYVTDDGADIVCATKNEERSYCFDHCTSLVVKKALTPKLNKIDLFGEQGQELVLKCRQAVNIVKSSKLRNLGITRLKLGLKRGPAQHPGAQTVFRSCLPMLKSVKKHFNQLEKNIRKMGHSTLDGVTIHNITDLIEVLSPLEAMAKKTNNCFVASHYAKIDALTAAKDTDSPLRAAVKQQVRSELGVVKALKLMQKCKKVVTLLKKSGMNDKLVGGAVKQEIDTRWLSWSDCFKSFFPSKASNRPENAKIEQINTILQDKGRLELMLSDDDVALIKKLISILEPFQEAILKFEAEKQPTIQHVVPQYQLLKAHVSPKGGDCEALTCLRRRLSEQLERKFASNISIRHQMGLFFWPKFSAMKSLAETERAEVLAAVRKLCDEQRAIVNRKSSQAAAAADPPPSKRARADASDSEDEYATLLDSDSPPVLDEVDQYLLIADPAVKAKDLLLWWKDKSPMFPILSRVVRMVLATPASSAASERRFSVAGRLISSRRNCLHPETVDAMLFLHDYIKKKGSISAR